MKVTVENKKGLQKDLKVFIDKETISGHLNQKYDEMYGEDAYEQVGYSVEESLTDNGRMIRHLMLVPEMSSGSWD